MSNSTSHPTAAQLNSPEQRKRRKIAREVARLYDAIARAAGFTPSERRTAFAISMRLYEKDKEPLDTPRKISLASIGQALTSKSDGDEARGKTARRHVSELFVHSIPRTGYQILTRYKGNGEAHKFVDHLLPIADLFNELLVEEIERICSIKGIDGKKKHELIEEARQRLSIEALDYLPRCEAEIISPEGESYARVSAPEAAAYCRENPGYSARAYKYSPPPADPPPRPLYDADLDRLKERTVRLAVDAVFDLIEQRNTDQEARRFWLEELLPAIKRAGESRLKIQGVDAGGEREEEDLTHGPDLSGVRRPDATDSPVDFGTDSEEGTPDKLSGVPFDNSLDSSYLENRFSEIDFLGEAEPASEIPPDPVPEPTRPPNFDTALEAAEFYARDGWHVLPICQFDQERGHCMAASHNKDPEKLCSGKRPLVAGKGTPGEGYTAASTDLGLIRDWYTRQFPDAGVGLRLDGHVLIDADVKDGAGGLESYQILADTFALPETLTAITHSGGRHYIFKLPDDLPADWLRSWTRVGDKVALPGIDLKVGKCGLIYAEPTRGSKGFYQWIDPTFPPATLPRECCDFLHEIKHKDEKPKAEKTRQACVYSSVEPQPLDTDQSKYFRDVARGSGQHARLLKIGTKLRCATRASAAEIADVMRWHAAHFSEPLNDEPWIVRTATSIERRF